MITAGYEAGKSIRKRGREALSDLESFLDELSESFWDKNE
jgi:hypothetical protein